MIRVLILAAFVAFALGARTDARDLRMCGAVLFRAHCPASMTVEVPSLKDGPVGDAQFGVVFSTAQEMFEQPEVMLDSKNKAFFDAAIVELEKRLNTPRGTPYLPKLETFRRRLAALRDVEAAIKFREDFDAVRPMFRAINPGRIDYVFVGVFAAEGTYNAAVRKDRALDTSFRETLLHQSNLDTFLPGIDRQRVAFCLAGGGDWASVNALGTRLTQSIMAGHI